MCLMGVPANQLQQVRRYQEAGLRYLQNSYCFISTANKEFKNFQDTPGQLGQTVGIELPYRFVASNSLTPGSQPTTQRIQTLTVDKEVSIRVDFTTQQFEYNVQKYMNKIGRGAIAEMGAKVEIDVASLCETNTYRFFGGGGVTIDSYGQLAAALAQLREFGTPNYNTKCYLPNTAVPAIVNSGLSQFAISRNNRIANSWEIAEMGDTKFYSSNLLPRHVAGTVGNTAGRTLTVFALGAPNPDGSISQITFTVSGAPGIDANAIKAYDKIRFSDGIANQANIRFLTFVGHNPCNCPVQIAATADAASDVNSRVTINFTPPLQAAAGATQNITSPITVGMVATVLPNHKCGLIISGDPLFLSMPTLPDQSPYVTANQPDKESNASFRMYYGSQFGQNDRGMIHDGIWGKTLIADYALMLVFPD